MTTSVDVAVIGAGMAGLTCAQQLAQAGYRVVILEKSRGVGGRIATRRLHSTFADHGTCYLSPKGELFWGFIEGLIEAGVLQVWTEVVHELDASNNLREPTDYDRYPRYVAENGMTAIAKFLANGLDIQLGQRVQTLVLNDSGWVLSSVLSTSVSPTEEVVTLQARAVVVAVPAPQALMLLQPLTEILSQEFIQTLAGVEFSPCLSVIAGYQSDRQQDWLNQYPNLRALTFTNDAKLGWVGLDSSKRLTPTVEPVFVIQSNATFAEQYLETDGLEPAAYQLLQQAAERLVPWLAKPEWVQIHRWRYAFAKLPLSEHCLQATTPFPLVCTGDWCGGMKVEQAFLSGLAAAEQIQSLLRLNSIQ